MKDRLLRILLYGNLCDESHKGCLRLEFALRLVGVEILRAPESEALFYHCSTGAIPSGVSNLN